MGKDRVYIRKSSQKDIDYLKSNLRITDIREILELSGMTPEYTLQYSFEKSDKCWTLLKGKEPIACFGVARITLLSDIGSVWLLASDKIRKLKIKALRNSKLYVSKIIQDYTRLENCVSVKNKISINWLKWCGFKLKEAEKLGINKEYYHKFYMIREV